MSNVNTILRHRFACKKYKSTMLSREVIDEILEAGRLSPTSFGLEPWTFHVCKSEDLLSSCFYQESMKSAPITVVITTKRGHFFDPMSEFIKKRAIRFPSTLDEFIDDYKGYYEFLRDNSSLDSWSRSQSYIACANMMTRAAELGVQSCAIEGYDNDKVISALKLDKNDEEVGIVIAFGYPDEEEREKIRISAEEAFVYHL